MDRELPKCFGTKEFSLKSGICRGCRHHVECRKERAKKIGEEDGENTNNESSN